MSDSDLSDMNPALILIIALFRPEGRMDGHTHPNGIRARFYEVRVQEQPKCPSSIFNIGFFELSASSAHPLLLPLSLSTYLTHSLIH